jgi:hypothetical protein
MEMVFNDIVYIIRCYKQKFLKCEYVLNSNTEVNAIS